MRIICPQCRNQLSIHRPSVAATRIKCRNCGNKFYAGKAEEVVEAKVAMVAAAPAESVVAAVVTAPAEEAFDQERKKEQRSANRERRRQSIRKKRLRWLLPLSIASLVGMIVLGLFFAKKPPPPPAPPTSSLVENMADRKPPRPLSKAPPIDSGALVIDVGMARRPDELVGTWTLQEPAGGTMALLKDGTATIKAAMLPDKLIETTGPWFVIKVDGQEFSLEIGPEPYRVDNYRLTVRLQSDGQLRVIRFMHNQQANFDPRMFQKSK